MEEQNATQAFDEPELIEKLHQVVSEQNLNSRTEQTYRHWILKFISFSAAKKSSESGEEQVNRFLGYLKVRLQLSKARMNQARQAIEFYFAYIVEKPLNQ